MGGVSVAIDVAVAVISAMRLTVAESAAVPVIESVAFIVGVGVSSRVGVAVGVGGCEMITSTDWGEISLITRLRNWESCETMISTWGRT